MGHSFGGAFTQLLLDRGLGAAGVGIASATPKGVRDLPLSTLRATTPVLGNPFNRTNAVGLSPKQFHYAFTNTIDRAASDEIWKRYHVPGSSRVLRQGAFSNLHRHSPMTVDYAKADRAPLLLLAFGEDHIEPPKASRHNAEKDHGPAVVEFEELAGLPHFPGVDGWEVVADRALAWATEHAIAGPLTAAG
jgi:pimeloyl-ACP methyl ester carboxylesterase